MSGQLTLQGTSHLAFSETKRNKVLRALAASTDVAVSAVHIVSVSACDNDAADSDTAASGTPSVKICFEIDAGSPEAELALEAALKGADFPAKFSTSLKSGAEAKKKKKGKGKKKKAKAKKSADNAASDDK